jgi:hypothetical protein
VLSGCSTALTRARLVLLGLKTDFLLDPVRTVPRFAEVGTQSGTAAVNAPAALYRGLEPPIFVDFFPDQLRRLRIIPDKQDHSARYLQARF